MNSILAAPFEILKRRLAAGEIANEEFEKKESVIEELVTTY